MKSFGIFILVTVVFMLSNYFVSAQIPYDSITIDHLNKFLIQESAENGKKNYEQLGISDINNVNWNSLNLTWNIQTGKLTRLYWAVRNLSGNLDLSDANYLEQVYLGLNDIKSINLKGCSSLNYLDLYDNDLDSIDLTTNPRLGFARFTLNNLNKVNLKNNPLLYFFCCTNNRVDSLDISGKPALKELFCSGNNMKYLKLEGCTSLMEISCIINNLDTLELHNMTYLKTFSGEINNLKVLDIKNCPNIESFECNQNQIKSLDFTSCVNLKNITCNNNQLEELQIAECIKLEGLNCNYNNLDSLILPNTGSLTAVSCNNNKMDLTKIPEIKSQYITYNYSPQKEFEKTFKYDSIDFVKVNDISDNISRYSWYSADRLVYPSKSDNGLFGFDESYINKVVRCRVSNNTFPKLVLFYNLTLTDIDDVSTVDVTEDTNSVYGIKGAVCIKSPSTVRVSIYSIRGSKVCDLNHNGGDSEIPLSSGIYIVMLNNKSYKVIVG